MEKLLIEAQMRPTRGKNAARQLRGSGLVPAVVYGGEAGPEALSVDPRLVEKVLRSEAGHNAVFTLAIKGQGKTPAMIRDWQLEPIKGSLLHVDFLRISMEARLKVHVPVETRGEPIGVKQQGGTLELVQRDVEVECLPGDIPDEFVVDVSELVIGKGIRVSDLQVDTTRVKILAEPDQVLVHVVPPRKVEEEKPAEEAVVAAGAEAEAAEPELIRKRKEAAEEEGEEGKEGPKAAAEGEKKGEKK
jgi:large subunit ribosomal protein L25